LESGKSEEPFAMNIQRRVLYSSANGDTWYLCRDHAGRVFILHEPNVPSGGQPSNIDLGAFLAKGMHGPEHQALLQLIGSLVEQGSGDSKSIRTA
jgi:hypothetical protein